MRRFSFIQRDVFTSEPLQGNPLAVFTDGRGLRDAEMQALAREMNLSETTFVLPRDAEVEREAGIRVKIFTPEEELPFAGHPTLGTAAVLREETQSGRRAGRQGAADRIVLDLAAGRVPVLFRTEPDGKVFGEMRQRDPEFGPTHDPREVAAVVARQQVQDIATDAPIETVSTGVPFAVVPVRSLDAVQRLRLDWDRIQDYTRRHNGPFSFYFVSRETIDPAARLHARMVFSNGEDPATGSAAGCAAAWMVRHGMAKPEEEVVIEQGLEIGRPSRIFVRAGMDGARVVNVRVGGYTVEVLRGEVTL